MQRRRVFSRPHYERGQAKRQIEKGGGDIEGNDAAEILRRPADFVRAAKLYCQPELKF